MSTTNDVDGIHFAAESALPAPSGGGTYAFRRSDTARPTLTIRSNTMSEKGVELSANDVDERDLKKKQVVKGRYLLWYELLFVANSSLPILVSMVDDPQGLHTSP